MECGAVLLALPSHKIASLRDSSALRPSTFRAWPKSIIRPWPRSCWAFAAPKSPIRSMDLACSFRKRKEFNILGALFSSSLFPNRAPEGEVVITCYIGGARAPAPAAQNARRVGGNRGQRSGNHFGCAGPAGIPACRRLSPGHSPIQPGLRKSPRLDERHGIQGPGPVCGRTRPRRRFPGRFHRLGSQSRGKNRDIFGVKPQAAPGPGPPRCRMNPPADVAAVYDRRKKEPCHPVAGSASVTEWKKVGRAVLCPPRRARSARPTIQDWRNTVAV